MHVICLLWAVFSIMNTKLLSHSSNSLSKNENSKRTKTDENQLLKERYGEKAKKIAQFQSAYCLYQHWIIIWYTIPLKCYCSKAKLLFHIMNSMTSTAELTRKNCDKRKRTEDKGTEVIAFGNGIAGASECERYACNPPLNWECQRWKIASSENSLIRYVDWFSIGWHIFFFLPF